MSFPRYPNYKDSGVEWLGEIPETWSPTRLRFLLRDGYEGMKIGPFGSQLTSEMIEECGEYKVYGQENIIANNFVRGSRYIGCEKYRELSVYEINPGDLLITMMGTSGRCDVAPTNIARGIMDSHLLRMRLTTAARTDFVRLLIDEAAYVGTQIQLAGKGSIMHGLNSSIVKNLLLLLPPIDEQTQIAAFLDRETAKIDELVAEQRRLMELLKEKRQAVISDAVTKGLNPDAPMKPSGIEWLGDVPEKWTVIQIRQAAKLESGHTPSRQHPEYWENCTVPWITLADVWQIRDAKAEYVFDTKEKVSELGLANSSARRLPKGTVILSRTASVGFSGIMGTDMATTQDFANWMCGPRLQPEFLLYVLRAMVGEFRRLMMGSTHNTIYMPDIKSLRFALPSLDQQIEIVEHVRAITREFDALTAEAQRVIDRLQERRTALISAAVTGQIDVRALSPTQTMEATT